MKTEFVTYEIALELKELGFDESCLKVGNPNGHTMWKWIEVDGEPPTVNINDVIQVHYDENWTQIPTFSQAFRFFRDKYELYYTIEGSIKEGFQYFVYTYEYEIKSEELFNTYEEAELPCLVKLIEIVKEKK
jgi:hypothetical protein